MSYSQKNEEAVILGYLGGKHGGQLLDIGAYDGKLFSNSLALIERGWGGVLAEPSPLPFHRLMELHALRRNRIHLVNAVISPSRQGVTTLHCSDDALSTIDEHDRSIWAAQANFREIVVQPMAMADLMNKYGRHYDFITIDADGVNLQLFDALPDDTLRNCFVICVEHQGGVDHITGRCALCGMEDVLMVNAENVIVGR